MHPKIMEILKAYRKYFPDSEIDLCTNGLLIPQMKQEFWECVKKERISIHVSGYKPTYRLLDRIDDILCRQGIAYTILKREEFVKYYTDRPDNDMQKSFEKCFASGCYEVYRERLSTCSAAIAFERFNEMFGTEYKITKDEDWFDIHDVDIDSWKVKEKLESPSYICKYCSDSCMESFKWEYSHQIVDIHDYLVKN